jgi:hypothetical protein
MRLMMLVTLASLVLAGCADSGKSAEDKNREIFGDTSNVESGKGLIRGLVLTPALVPVPGANVELVGTGKNETTKETGAFVFVVSKLGWTKIQQSVEVVANKADPPIAKVQLEKIPGSEPKAMTLQQDGFISCSIGTPQTIHDCNTTAEQKSTLFWNIEGRPQWIQTELVWRSTQPTGDWFYVIQAVCECGGRLPAPNSGMRFNETYEATSPHVAKAIPEFLQKNDVGGANKQVVIDVSASGPEPEVTNGSGVALNQAFKAYVTFFYNFDPDPAWTFTADGPYPVPSGG